MCLQDNLQPRSLFAFALRLRLRSSFCRSGSPARGCGPERASHGCRAEQYDLLLQGGHVIDPRNNVDAIRDVAISAGKIAAIAPKIDAADAAKTIDARGLFVTPGIVDIHTHVYAGTGEKGSYAGDNSVYPDVVAPRSGVTTVVDAGSSGLAQLRGFQAAHHRSLDHPRPCLSEHRRPRHARWKVRTGSVGHGCPTHGGHGAPVSGPDCRHQDRALLRTRVDPRGARRRSRARSPRCR